MTFGFASGTSGVKMAGLNLCGAVCRLSISIPDEFPGVGHWRLLLAPGRHGRSPTCAPVGAASRGGNRAQERHRKLKQAGAVEFPNLEILWAKMCPTHCVMPGSSAGSGDGGGGRKRPREGAISRPALLCSALLCPAGKQCRPGPPRAAPGPCAPNPPARVLASPPTLSPPPSPA